MCPACVTTAVVIAAGAAGKGRFASLVRWLAIRLNRGFPRSG
jgi:hypothetical protein